MRIAGTWQDDKRFGMQVKVRMAEPVAPSGDLALIAYLKRVKHIGGGRAGRLLERYGDGVLEAIDDDPGPAFRQAGLNPKRVNEAIRSWNGLRSTRALHLLLAPHGLAWLVPRIAQEYGDRARDVVRSRPYELTSVFGVGFAIADTIARAAGIPRDSVGRTRAAVVHCSARPSATGRPACRSPTWRRARPSCSAARRRPPSCSTTCATPTSSCSRSTTASSGPTARRRPRSRRSWRRRSAGSPSASRRSKPRRRRPTT